MASFPTDTVDSSGTVDWTNREYSDLSYTPASGTSAVFTTARVVAPLLFTSPVVFNGAYFTGDDFGTVHFVLWYDDVLILTSPSFSLSGVPTFFSSGYGGLVDRVDVVTDYLKIVCHG